MREPGCGLSEACRGPVGPPSPRMHGCGVQSACNPANSGQKPGGVLRFQAYLLLTMRWPLSHPIEKDGRSPATATNAAKL